MRDLLFISRRDNHWLDSWTYGDWRQYIARRADGALQCCRVSGLPFFMAALGAMTLLVPLCAAFFILNGIPLNQFNWPRIVAASVIGFGLLFPSIITLLGPWTLMTAVGPRQYDGKRVYPGEPRP